MIESATFWKDAPEIETGEIVPRRAARRCSSSPPPRTWRRRARSPRPSAWSSGGRRPSTRPATSARTCGSSTTWAGWSRSGWRVDGPARRARAEARLELPRRGLAGRRLGRAVGRGRAAADQRLRRRHRQGRQQLPRAQGRRLHRLRLLDLLRRLRGRGEPGRAPHAALGAGPVRRRVGLDVAREPPRALQPRLGRPGRQAVERAQEARLVGRGQGRVDRATTSRTSRRPPHAGHVPPKGSTGRRGPARRRRVHHAGRRQGLAVRAERRAGRAAAHALRGPRVAGAQPALRPAGQPDRARSTGGRTTRRTRTRASAARDRGVPVRAHHRAADRAPHGGRDEPAAAVPVGAAARAVRRGLPRAGAHAEADAPGRVPRGHQPGGRAGPGHGDGPDGPAAGGRARGAPGVDALPLGRERHRDRGRRERPVRRRRRPERLHPGEQGRHVRRPAGPASARAADDGAAARRAGAGRDHGRDGHGDLDGRRAPRTRRHVEQAVDGSTAPPASRRHGARRRREGPQQPVRPAGRSGGRRRVRRRPPGTRRLLHRHLGVHRLQGLRGGLQDVERRAGRRPRSARHVVRQHRARWARTRGGTSPSSSSRGRPATRTPAWPGCRRERPARGSRRRSSHRCCAARSAGAASWARVRYPPRRRLRYGSRRSKTWACPRSASRATGTAPRAARRSAG